MFATLIDTLTSQYHPARSRRATLRGRLAAAATTWRGYSEERRTDRDIAAITAALSRLSARRLALLGLRRNRLSHDVETLMRRACESRGEAAEILAIVERAGWPSGDVIDDPGHREVPLQSVSLGRRAA